MQVVLKIEKVFVLKHWSIKSYSPPSTAVILLDGVENFLARPWSPFRFNRSPRWCVCVCGCILHVPVCVPLHFCMCGCLCADSYVMHICLYMSIYVCARVGAIMLRHLMINLYLTCLFTELLCRALWGLCCTQCCKQLKWKNANDQARSSTESIGTP